jgi:hypothetical protein
VGDKFGATAEPSGQAYGEVSVPAHSYPAPRRHPVLTGVLGFLLVAWLGIIGYALFREAPTSLLAILGVSIVGAGLSLGLMTWLDRRVPPKSR